jgi:hypothetical protein
VPIPNFKGPSKHIIYVPHFLVEREMPGMRLKIAMKLLMLEDFGSNALILVKSRKVFDLSLQRKVDGIVAMIFENARLGG